jgi:hypothetical protein
MNLLDENVPEHQRQLLRSWRIPVRQIGQDVGRKGLSDDAIISQLHQHPRPTFFTRDEGFYRRTLCHPAYCLVCLAVSQYEAASFVRRFLHHPVFATHAQRWGTVVRVSRIALHRWRLHQTAEEELQWLD